MKRNAILVISIGFLIMASGAYFAFFNANQYSNVPWWCFVLFFLGAITISIGYAMFKITRPKVKMKIKREPEEAEVVIVPKKEEPQVVIIDNQDKKKAD